MVRRRSFADPSDRYSCVMSTSLHDRARGLIENAREPLIALSHRLHAEPELAFEEFCSSELISERLEAAGFSVARGVCELPTAFTARRGDGDLHVAICAEYDALPAVGHACGHNIIAAAAVGAGLALGELAADAGLTVSVIGTPAEEGGGGKVLMLERGVFAGVHAALMVHPGPFDQLQPPVLAAQSFDVRYEGREAHAAAYPQRGVNAADAFVVAQVAIGLLRQHLRATDRVHGIVVKGGDAPNIVPALTTGRWMVRAETLDALNDVRDKAYRCFEAGALATGATVSIEARPAYAHMEHDTELVEIYRRNAEALGRDLSETGEGALRAFSTDMGNVSLAVPSIHPIIGIGSFPAVNHQPEFAAACAAPAADQAILDGAIAMAWTALDAASDPALRRRLLATGAGGAADIPA